MKRDNKKNSINWVFNTIDARRAVQCLGARNLTLIEAVELISTDKERVIASYADMIMYSGDEADKRLRRWITKVNKDNPDTYVYFRFNRWN